MGLTYPDITCMNQKMSKDNIYLVASMYVSKNTIWAFPQKLTYFLNSIYFFSCTHTALDKKKEQHKSYETILKIHSQYEL